jgi:hypothetical protein
MKRLRKSFCVNVNVASTDKKRMSEGLVTGLAKTQSIDVKKNGLHMPCSPAVTFEARRRLDNVLASLTI